MISRIEALKYRCLRYVNQPLERFQVLVGPNASGKSSFLDVVALLGDFVRDGLDEAVLRNPRHPHGRATTVDELIFNQSADRFELAVELRIPQKLRRQGNGSYERVRYEVALGKKRGEWRAGNRWRDTVALRRSRREGTSGSPAVGSLPHRTGWAPILCSPHRAGREPQ